MNISPRNEYGGADQGFRIFPQENKEFARYHKTRRGLSLIVTRVIPCLEAT